MDDEDLSASDALEQAIQRLRPSTSDIEYMTRLTILECNDVDLLPPSARQQLENRSALEAEVAKMSQARPEERARREL